MIGRRLRQLSSLPGAVASACAAVPAAYLGILTAAGVANGRRRTPSPTPVDATRFAVYIPAHNEATIIASTVRALTAQRYPTDRFSVHVVADNCTDDTVSVAAAAGAVVHERHAPDQPGKGPALNWLHDRLADQPSDAVVIIDADTIAEPGFLLAMDAAFADGATAAQGFYGVSDPEIGPAVALRYAAIACRHHLRPLGRTALGGSCGLFGNGMAFRSDLLTTHRWSGHLIEDAEFQMELLFDGLRVAYVPEARLAAEMPASFDGAQTQNERWELGRLQLTRQYVPRLFRQVLAGGRLPRRTYLDGAADHLLPPMSALAALDVVALAASGIGVLFSPGRLTRVAWWAAVLSAVTTVAHVFCALRLVRAPSSVYRSLASAPKLILWKLGLLKKVARRPDLVSWTRTTRNAESPVAARVSVASDVSRGA